MKMTMGLLASLVMIAGLQVHAQGTEVKKEDGVQKQESVKKEEKQETKKAAKADGRKKHKKITK